MYLLKELCLDYVKTSQSNNPPKTEAEFKHFSKDDVLSIRRVKT